LVVYAKDAMDGLDIANKISDVDIRQKMIQELREAIQSDVMEAGAKKNEAAPVLTRATRSAVARDLPVYLPPDLDRHVLRDYPIDHIFPYVNLQTLIGHHLGLKGKVDQLLAAKDPKAVHLREVIEELFLQAKNTGTLRAQGMYRFFPAQSDGNDIVIYDPKDKTQVLHRFSFPRQDVEPFLCLADFLRSVDSGEMDYVGFLVVTAGQGVRDLANEWKDKGDYLRSHALQALALEMAEGFAERVHHIMRDVWGYPDSPELTMQQRWGARYQGIRVSFGYPACPNLEDQEPLFRLMQPEDIGVELTEGFMMEPEASVTAMVFAHPEARYFNVDKA
jgi:5-methyltetrahydrofolate--homocysteine methyltransferase